MKMPDCHSEWMSRSPEQISIVTVIRDTDTVSEGKVTITGGGV